MSNQVERVLPDSSNSKSNHRTKSDWIMGLIIAVLCAALVFCAVMAKRAYDREVNAAMAELGADISITEVASSGSESFCNETELSSMAVNIFPHKTKARIVNDTDSTLHVIALMEGSYVTHDTLFDGELPAGEHITVDLEMRPTVFNLRSAANALEEPRRAGVCAIVSKS